ncbi:MAG: hypothetical protein IPM82_01805 [Saprospiraceae bacterium]|nr:hypothetical protein [Saprospiraceae bacterium]
MGALISSAAQKTLSPRRAAEGGEEGAIFRKFLGEERLLFTLKRLEPNQLGVFKNRKKSQPLFLEGGVARNFK